jgi:hypothetical protein
MEPKDKVPRPPIQIRVFYSDPFGRIAFADCYVSDVDPEATGSREILGTAACEALIACQRTLRETPLVSKELREGLKPLEH